MIVEKSQDGKPVIDLQGPEGNAFVLIGMAAKWSKQLGLDPKEVQADMMSGDYEHLLSVIEKHFGDYIVMYR
jgi:hypothetical protein